MCLGLQVPQNAQIGSSCAQPKTPCVRAASKLLMAVWLMAARQCWLTRACAACVCSVDGGTTMYVRENHKHQLLLMHVLVVALDVEGWVLAAPLFDALCKELKMTAPDVVSR